MPRHSYSCLNWRLYILLKLVQFIYSTVVVVIKMTCLFELLPPTRRICFRRFLSVCLFVCLIASLCKNFHTDLHEIFTEGWQWATEQLIKFRWRSGLPSRYRDCFPDSSLLASTESGISRLHCATLQWWTCTSGLWRHRPQRYELSQCSLLLLYLRK